MDIVAIIPARGGSKEIPKKNIKEIAGKPLISWSINQAQESTLIDDVIVSTDCHEIAEISKTEGASVPFMRPKDLASDSATTESAILHCIEQLNNEKKYPKIIVLIQCTSPIRSEDCFDNAIRYFIDNDYDSMLSVCRSNRFYWKNMLHPKPLYDFINRPRRQDIKTEDQQFLESGSFYIMKTKNLQESGNRLSGKIGMFLTKDEEQFEIDTMLDFKVCEALLIEKQSR